MKTHLAIAKLTMLVLILNSIPVIAQRDSVNRGKVKLTDFYFSLGLWGKPGGAGLGVQDFRSLAPGSPLLANDLTGYAPQDYYDNDFYVSDDVGGVLGFFCGLSFRDQNGNIKPHSRLRIGIKYVSGRTYNFGLQYSERKPYDTLTSSQTGEQMYIDSIFTGRYSMEYHEDEVHIDVSLLYRFLPTARFSPYAGAGASAGLIFNAETRIDYNYNTYENFFYAESFIPTNYGTDGYLQPYSSTESYANKNGFVYNLFVPVGVELRFTRKPNPLRHFNIFLEVLPSLTSHSVPDLRTIMKPTVYFSGGLRFFGGG